MRQGMRMNYSLHSSRSGFTLIELVVTLVVLAIGVSSFIIFINQVTLSSVDQLLRVQANAVAQSYLEEILQQQFCDPDLNCPAVCSSPCSTNCTSLEGSRDLYDDVFDYNALNQVPTDRNDNPLGLGDYDVLVTIDDSGVTLDTLSSAACEVVRIDVDVTHTLTGTLATLSAFKVNY